MSETPASRRAAIWVVAVFLLGAIAGGMFGYGYAHRSVAAASTAMPEPERRAKRVEQLTRELSLTSDQAKQLDSIQKPKFEEFLRKMDEERKHNIPK